MSTTSARCRLCLLWLGVVLVAAAGVATVEATWSVVAVDPDTREVGVVGASCVEAADAPATAFLIAGVVPGTGAAVSQARLNPQARDRAIERIAQGELPAGILAELTDPAFDPLAAERQHAVVTLAGGAAAYTGAATLPFAGDAQDRDSTVSVQGNLLESEAVVMDALRAFTLRPTSANALSDRLMRALEAGGRAGGDRRCNTSTQQQTALFAFIVVAGPSDDIDSPSLVLVATSEPGGASPLIALRAEYDAWRRAHPGACPTCRNPAVVPSSGSAGFPQDAPSRNPGSLVFALVASVSAIGVALASGQLLRILRR